MRVIIETIPHSDQRYDTVGDWQITHYAGGIQLHLKVSDLTDWRYIALVAVHELVEALTCEWQGVSEHAVDEFDKKWNSLFEAERYPYPEPGEDPAAPYYHQHQFASGIERLLAAELGVNWTKYEEAVNEAGKLE